MAEIIEITIPGTEEVVRLSRGEIVDLITERRCKNGGTQASSIDNIVINALDAMMQQSEVKTVAEGMGKNGHERFQNPNYQKLREGIGKTIETIIKEEKITPVESPS